MKKLLSLILLLLVFVTGCSCTDGFMEEVNIENTKNAVQNYLDQNYPDENYTVNSVAVYDEVSSDKIVYDVEANISCYKGECIQIFQCTQYSSGKVECEDIHTPREKWTKIHDDILKNDIHEFYKNFTVDSFTVDNVYEGNPLQYDVTVSVVASTGVFTQRLRVIYDFYGEIKFVELSELRKEDNANVNIPEYEKRN